MVIREVVFASNPGKTQIKRRKYRHVFIRIYMLISHIELVQLQLLTVEFLADPEPSLSI